MIDKVIEKIEYGSESETLDFKKSEYDMGNAHSKEEFLKDICAMVNHPSSEDKFIIIGVKEKNGVANEFYNIDELTDQAKYQQLLNSNIEPEIQFEYKPISYKDNSIAYFRVYGNDGRPYLFKKPIKSANIGSGFIRVGSSTRNPYRDDFEYIYVKRHETIDRKKDLLISHVISNPEEVGEKVNGLFCFDINLSNTSNKSIELDIEMEITKTDDYILISYFDFKKMVNKVRKPDKVSYHSSFLPNIRFPEINYNFNVDVNVKNDSLIATRTPTRFEKYALTLKQNETFENVFMNEVAILCQKECSVVAKITMRSDDFTEGAWEYKLEVPIVFT